MTTDAPLDNMTVNDDKSIRITTPDGEELVYTRNEDGTYNCPAETVSGLKVNYQDENGNAIAPGITTEEDIRYGAQWYKDHEAEIRADRAAEEAHQQALRDLEAEKDRVWLENERSKYGQLSQTSIDLMNEERQRKIDYEHEVLLDKIGLKHGTVEDYVTKNKENIMNALKRDTIKEYIKGGEYEGEAAKWDDRIVTAQETKFVVDQTVNAYGMLTHDPVLPKAYNAASNYTETLTDAYVNGKDMKQALVKATADTTIDLVVDKGENYGFTAAVLSNTLGSGAKQMNDNLYNGREITDGVYDSMKGGAVTGLVSGGANKLIQVSKGTVLDTKIADIGPNTRLDFWNNPKVGNVDANIPTGKVHTDVETDGMRQTSIAERRMGEGSFKPNTPDLQTSKPNVSDMQTGKTNLGDSNTGNVKQNTNVDGNSGNVKQNTNVDNNTGKVKQNTNVDGNSGNVKQNTNVDNNTGSPTKPKPGDGNIDSTKSKTGGTESKNQSSASDAANRAQANEDWQGTVAMNKVRKLHKISEKMAAMEKANPKNFQNDPEYQKLSKDFDAQAREVRESKPATDRMNMLQGKTGTDLRKRYNKSDIEYEKKVLQYRNESLAKEYGLNPDQIGDYNVTSHKIAEKLAGGKASHDTDTSPYMKVNTGTGKNAKVDFTQVDGDHHLARAIYKAEHGRYPQTAAEYDEALRLKELRDFTNVSTRPSDTHELHHNPDAYVGSGKGDLDLKTGRSDVDKVLHPEKYGTPEKGTGILNKQTAIHKQELSLNRHHQQYAEAQQLRQKLNTDKTLSAAEKTAMGKKIADLESQSASNHYESVRTTAKEFNIIKNINDVNIKNGLGDGLSKEAKQIGRWANQVAEGRLEVETYKQLVTKLCGSEENALKIVADGFRTTNK